MTAMRMGWAATLAAAAALWLYAASLLWRTSVPHDLKLPRLHGGDFFTPAELHRAIHFSDVLSLLGIASILTDLVVLAVVAWYGRRIAAAFPVGRIGQGVLVGAVAGLFVWLAELPFSLAGTWWERRYGLVLDDYWTWGIGAWITLGMTVLGTTIFIVLLMALAEALPRTWWIAAAVVFTAIDAALAAGSSYLIFDTKPIRDHELAAKVALMEKRENVEGIHVDIEKVSDQTSLVNAYTIGFGPTQRVVLWDTLVDRMSTPEVVTVVAHELGHVRSRHVLKGVGWGGLVSLPLLLVVALATRRRGGMRAAAAVPVALLVLSAVNLVIAPIYNEVSRRYE